MGSESRPSEASRKIGLWLRRRSDDAFNRILRGSNGGIGQRAIAPCRDIGRNRPRRVWDPRARDAIGCGLGQGHETHTGLPPCVYYRPFSEKVA